jgi:N-acyl-D-amino-acid deacylase
MMKRNKEIANLHLSRRNFLKLTAGLTAAAAVAPWSGCAQPAKAKPRSVRQPIEPQQWPPSERVPHLEVRGSSESRTLLKNGLIVDGTAKPAFYGDVLINGDRIELISSRAVVFDGNTLDCTGKVIAPGFIDMHSHMDWVLPVQGRPELSSPFTEQGVTTFVTGNCGFGVAGFKPDSRFRNMIDARTEGLYSLDWNSMAEYFDRLRRNGLTHNLLNLAGHGTTRTSIRGYDASPLKPDEMRELLFLLEESMDQGAGGISLGLQYEPGIFASIDELKQIARLVKSKDKILTVHMKAYSALSGTYPLKLIGGRPHNLLAIEDMLRLARETGVRLQLSHLIFVGSSTWDSCHEALELIEDAIAQGIDVKFDTYAYHCGTSVINVFFPEWFLAKVPKVYASGFSLLRLNIELQLITLLLGFGYGDIQITDADHPELNRYNGMFLKDIAKQRNMSQFDNFIDIARLSDGRARVLNHRYSNPEIVHELMRHPAALFMTDATPATQGVQNPAVYGNFPRFLQDARDHRLMSLEETVHKMTGASAARFRIKDRGALQKGWFADITVFDWSTIKDNNTAAETDCPPSGIEAVFINGRQVVAAGRADGAQLPGMVL